MGATQSRKEKNNPGRVAPTAESPKQAPVAAASLPTLGIDGAAIRKESQPLEASESQPLQVSDLQQSEVSALVSVCLSVTHIPVVPVNVSNQTTNHFPQESVPFPKEELGVHSNLVVGTPPEVEQQKSTPGNNSKDVQ